MDEVLTRRGTLLRLAGLVAAGLGVESWRAGEGPAGVASGTVRCVLAPEQTEGPYYIEDEKIRRNITDGRRGVPTASPFSRRSTPAGTRGARFTST
jgi:hypothetical protein